MITEFKGDYRFLSNFWFSTMNIRGVKFRTNEHFYQAMKVTSNEDFIRIVNCKTPWEARKFGNKIQCREDWLDFRDKVMYYGLMIKFKDEHLRKLLLETGDEELVEGNTWNDKHWGFCLKTNEGENILGLMLMNIREKIRRGIL